MKKIDPAALDSREMHELMVGCVAPRPIAFVSTIGEDGVYNVAPFSFFTLMSMHPTVVGFAIGRKRGGSKKRYPHQHRIFPGLCHQRRLRDHCLGDEPGVGGLPEPRGRVQRGRSHARGKRLGKTSAVAERPSRSSAG